MHELREEGTDALLTTFGGQVPRVGEEVRWADGRGRGFSARVQRVVWVLEPSRDEHVAESQSALIYVQT